MLFEFRLMNTQRFRFVIKLEIIFWGLKKGNCSYELFRNFEK